jgi:hypothetical protein
VISYSALQQYGIEDQSAFNRRVSKKEEGFLGWLNDYHLPKKAGTLCSYHVLFPAFILYET